MCNTVLHEEDNTKVKGDLALVHEGDRPVRERSTNNQLEQCRAAVWSEGELECLPEPSHQADGLGETTSLPWTPVSLICKMNNLNWRMSKDGQILKFYDFQGGPKITKSWSSLQRFARMG